MYADTSECHLIWYGWLHQIYTLKADFTNTITRADELVTPSSILNHLSTSREECGEVGYVDLSVANAKSTGGRMQ